jgi:hypothetical protein
MMLFGDNINIKCTEETVDLITNGIVGEMLVNIPINVFNNASKTRFTIQANGIEQEIQACDFIGTTF